MNPDQSSTPEGRRGPYAKTAERRRSIVAAAHTVFAAHGYRGGSLQDVADRVGMSQTSLLYYFPSKSELLLAVLNYRDSIDGDGGSLLDPAEGLVAVVLRQAAYNEKIPGVIELYTVLCAESLTQNHPGREFFVHRFEALRASYTRKFTELQQAGCLRTEVDPARAAATLVALWDGIQTQWLVEPASVDVVLTLRDYFDLIILPSTDRALAARTAGGDQRV
jgi:AcrR family transcriptional regulator